jgi:cyclic-di-AMP phosphodiesterase PgpH
MPEQRNGASPPPGEDKRPSSRLSLPLRNDDDDADALPRASREWRRNLTFIGFNLLLIAAVSLILLAQFLPFGALPTGAPTIAVGQPAPQTYYAPLSISYVSDVLTNQDKDAARKNPANLAYDVNTTLVNEQRAALQSVLFTIGSIRSTSGSSIAQKVAALQSSTVISLPTAVAQTLASLSESAWQDLASDSRRTFDTLMSSRALVNDEDVARALQDVYQLTPRTFSDEQRAAELAIVRPFIKPNRLLNDERTKANQDAAVAAVKPRSVDVLRGEVVVTKGQIVSAADAEKLEHLGIKPSSLDWQDFVSVTGLVAMLLLLASIYLFLTQPNLWYRRRPLLLLGLSLILPTLVARFTTGHLLWPYALPFAGVSIVIAVLLNAEIAVVYTFVLSMLVGLLVNNSLDLTIFYFTTGLSAIYATWRAERSSDFVRAGLYVSVISYLMLLLLRLAAHDLDSTALLEIAAASLINGSLSATFSFATFNLLGNLFGTTTPLQLLELAHPTQPLLRRLMRDAPGTYHHSLVVSNLAERAAEVVGADPLLARVGAYYHDIGKVTHPAFFVDNQAGMDNIHDNLDPLASARIIASHVRDGIELAKKYHLPRRVRDIIPQHHGTTVIRYFYEKAVAADGADKVEINDFRYPGPRPQSKEAAIVMLADSVEAASRAAAQSGRLGSTEQSSRQSQRFDEDAVGEIVHKVIRDKIEDGQLDECNLTIRDLHEIEIAFRAMLRGVYHPRITYPEKTAPPAPPPPPQSSTKIGEGVDGAIPADEPTAPPAPLGAPPPTNGAHPQEAHAQPPEDARR